MNKKLTAIFFAILAAILYAINIPFSKQLLNYISPSTLASLLYLGAGIGIGMVFLCTKKKTKEDEKITSSDLPYIIGMILLDIIASILLMFGLQISPSTSASLLNNFEIVCTSIIALVIFKEKISYKLWVAIIIITIASFVLALDDVKTFHFSIGSLLVLLATMCWGFENNCTKKLSTKNTYNIVFLKGIFSGIGSLIIAICLREGFPNFKYIIMALILGFIAYGLSIFFYIKAQGIIGASRTSAYYSIAPFIGAFLSFVLLREHLTWFYFLGLVLMIVGTIIVVIDTLSIKIQLFNKEKL